MLVRLTGALVAALSLLAGVPAGAAAQLAPDPQRVYEDYRADAQIEPCDHTVATYRRTLREITPDVEEETPAFRPAVEAALRERERGRRGCLEPGDAAGQPDAGGVAAGGSVPNGQSAPPAASPVPGRPAPAGPGAAGAGPPAPAPDAPPAPTVAPPPPVTSSAPPPPSGPVLVDRPRDGTPVGLLIALGLLGLTALGGALALAAARFGWAEERLAGARHAWGEAGYRAGATWADFVDWIGLGKGPHRL